MKTRELAALLRILKAHGVTSYRAGDVSVTFGDHSQAHQAPPAEDEADDHDQELPDGVIDPRKKLAEIYSKRGKRAA